MRAAGGSSSRGRGPSAAADVPPASGRERTGEPSRKKGAASAAPDPSAADGNAADGNVPPVDYHALYDVPECPVFHPTAKEFNHPGKYIESISEQVSVGLIAPERADAEAGAPHLQGRSRRRRPMRTRCGPLASARLCRRRRGSRPS
jgi:hypothetical protein